MPTLLNKENRQLGLNEGFSGKKNMADERVRNLFGAQQSTERSSDELSKPTKEYINSILDKGEGPRAFNPFLKSDGSLVNPYANYQEKLDSPTVNSQVKKWMSEATGLKPTATQNTADTGTDRGDFSGFNAGLQGDQLGALDVANELPKLDTKQIGTIIGRYFNKSPVISVGDAKGIFDAQQSTGMSALAILGIGALESGYGTSQIAKQKNNLWGYGAVNSNPLGGASAFAPVASGASQFAQKFMSTYYNKYGAKSINQAGTGNNPAGKGYAYHNNGSIDSSWADKVGSIMNKFYDTAKSVWTPGGSYSGTRGDSMVNKAKQFLGTPYVWGGTTPNGFDCSGLMQYVAKQMGVNLSRTTYTQINEGTPVSSNNLKAGDLVFFGSANNPHHVGMYVGNGQYLHAPQTGDVVKISSLGNRKDFIAARRIV